MHRACILAESSSYISSSSLCSSVWQSKRPPLCMHQSRNAKDHSRRSVKCFGKIQDRSVFQMSPPRGDSSIAEVREAYEACAMYADENGRRQCYALFGLDSERIDRYYHTVMDLEKALVLDEPEQRREVSPPGISFLRLFVSLLGAFVLAVVDVVASLMTRPVKQRHLVHK